MLDTAFDVARRYKSFSSYGSEAAAIRALHRRCPIFSEEQCRDAFHQAVNLFEVAMEAVCIKHKDFLLKTWQTPQGLEASNVVCNEIHHLCPDISFFGKAAVLAECMEYGEGNHNEI